MLALTGIFQVQFSQLHSPFASCSPGSREVQKPATSFSLFLYLLPSCPSPFFPIYIGSSQLLCFPYQGRTAAGLTPGSLYQPAALQGRHVQVSGSCKLRVRRSFLTSPGAAPSLQPDVSSILSNSRLFTTL